jgi:uncharacterized integral membrane protein
MNTLAVLLGVFVGLLLLGLNAWVIRRILRLAQAMPPRKTPRYLVLSYLCRFAVLIIVVGLLIWKFGLRFGLGILGGMILGQLVFFIVGITRTKKSALEYPN